MPYTKSLNHAAYALDYQNEYMSSRGTFWESGGDATIGSSSTDPIVNVGAVTVRINDAEYSTGGETQVILAENSGPTPRKDLIVAEAPASGDTADPPNVHAIAGTAIDSTAYNAITDDNGNLVADPPALPEVQPPAGTNLKGVATPLHVIYVPPGTTDSTDLEMRGLEDVRKEGVGVSDVLRSGDAVKEIEDEPNTISATVTNSEQYGGKTPTQRRREPPNVVINTTLTGGSSSDREIVYLPDGMVLQVWSLGSTAFEDRAAVTRAQIQTHSNNEWTGNTSTEEAYYTPPSGAVTIDTTDEWYAFRVVNISSDQQTVIGHFAFTIEEA